MPEKSRRWFSLAWLALPTIVAAAVVVVLVNWPAPADVEIGALVTSLQFRGHGTDRQVLLESTHARWLALRGFDEIRFTPKAVWIADPAKHDFQHDTYPSDAWSPLPIGRTLVLRTSGRTDAAVTIQPFGELNGSLALGEIFVGPSDINFRSPEKNSLSVEMRGQKVDGEVPLPEEFRIDADLCVREGDPLAQPGSPMTLRVLLGQSSRLLEYSSQSSGMQVAVGYLPDHKESFLGQAGFAVDEIRFLDQGPTGHPESTLAGAGAIQYARYPAAGPVTLSAGDFLDLDDLSRFYLREIAPGDDTKSLRIHLGGVAGKIRSGPPGRVADRRLTHFNSVRQNPAIVTLFTILAWIVPTLIAARKFYRELQ